MKNNSTIIGGIIVILIIVGLIFYALTATPAKAPTQTTTVTQSDPKNGTYFINGENVTLKNGVSEIDTSGSSATKIVTKYFGNEVTADLDGDGSQDTAFLITQNTGGSGTFYYAVAQLHTKSGSIGSEGLFLGDRIAPQSTSMGTGTIIVINYADRKPGESFAVAPSVGKSIWLLLDPKTMQFGEVSQNFTGEADPAKMTLGMQTWKWQNTTYATGTPIIPKTQGRFTITFKDPKNFSAVTDCNGVGGVYTVNGNKIIFTNMVSTLMFCENSQESQFSSMLTDVQSYTFSSKGELVFNLKKNGGVMIFR